MNFTIFNRKQWGTFACLLLASLGLCGGDVKIKTGKGRTKLSETEKKITSTNNMKRMLLAFHQYHAANRTLPPAYTVDANGKPLHSWRVLILPYMEQKELYGKIRLDEPWDSEYNKQFHNRDLDFYHSAGTNSPKGFTDFSMVIGPDTVSDGPTARSFGDITDGSSNTILLVERATPVCWMDPTEVTQEAAFRGFGASPDGIAAFYDGGKTAVVGVLDGSTQQVKADEATPEQIQITVSRASGKRVTIW